MPRLFAQPLSDSQSPTFSSPPQVRDLIYDPPQKALAEGEVEGTDGGDDAADLDVSGGGMTGRGCVLTSVTLRRLLFHERPHSASLLEAAVSLAAARTHAC